MTPQIKSQIFGLSLAFTTAMGCVVYEKLVKIYSYPTMGLLYIASYIPFICLSFFFKNSFIEDLQKVSNHKWLMMIYILSGVTSPLWYWITKYQNVVVGATYEIKYIVVLAVFYLLFGDNTLSWNTVIGVALALTSVYFISK